MGRVAGGTAERCTWSLVHRELLRRLFVRAELRVVAWRYVVEGSRCRSMNATGKVRARFRSSSLLRVPASHIPQTRHVYLLHLALMRCIHAIMRVAKNVCESSYDWTCRTYAYTQAGVVYLNWVYLNWVCT